MSIGRTARLAFQRIAVFAAVLTVMSPLVAAAPGPMARAASATTNFPVHAEFDPNDSYFNCVAQWGLCKIGAPSAWDVTLGSPSVVVAVVDTGVWWTHEDLQANMWTNPNDGTHGFDFIDGDRNPMDNDPSGLYHGTGVAGVIAAITNNGKDIAGTAQVKVMALRALGLNGQGSSLNTSQAIRRAADNGAKVINLSLGTNETFGGPTDIQLAVDYAWSKGALVVAAAGNGGTSALDYPARLPNVVSVAAIDETGRKAGFSNYGSGLDLAAPGTTIFTLGGGANDQLHTLQGTSFAAPFVSATAALLLSLDGNLTNVELWNILNSTAVQPAGGTGYNTDTGWGVVNAWNAINALNQPFISVNAYPTTVSRSSTFGVTWSILGPAGTPVTDTHVVWGIGSGRLGNATAPQTGSTRQSYTASGLTLPSGTDTFYFKVVATVGGTTYESREYTVGASSLPDFLFVLYQLLASNLLYLALFILALAAIVAFLPQRRAARARRAGYRSAGLYPTNYYAPTTLPSQPPPTTVQSRAEAPPIEFVRPVPTSTVPSSPPPTTVAAKKRCPNCGTMVSGENLFCFFCGNPFR